MGNITIFFLKFFCTNSIIREKFPGALDKTIIFKQINIRNFPKSTFVTAIKKYLTCEKKLLARRDKRSPRVADGNSIFYGRNTVRRIAVSSVIIIQRTRKDEVEKGTVERQEKSNNAAEER